MFSGCHRIWWYTRFAPDLRTARYYLAFGKARETTSICCVSLLCSCSGVEPPAVPNVFTYYFMIQGVSEPQDLFPNPKAGGYNDLNMKNVNVALQHYASGPNADCR